MQRITIKRILEMAFELKANPKSRALSPLLTFLLEHPLKYG